MSDKLIAVVGVSEEETAHLRLLIRKCAAQLDNAWRWGSEGNADLLVVDPGSFAGQMARTRALAAGMRCAIFAADPTDVADDGALVLRRPLMVANVLAVLNETGMAAPRNAQIASHGADFYSRELGDEALHDTENEEQRRATASAPSAPIAPGLDELLRPEPVELRSPPPAPSADIVPPSPAAPPRIAPAATATGPARNYSSRAAMLADTEPRPLRAYLDEDFLRAPAIFQLDDAPPLALDPKLRVAHSSASLAALRPYCHASWRLRDWRALTTLELNDLRKRQPAIPYSRLIWLLTLIHSNGQLAAHLDPGGTYRLTHWLEIERELGRYFRVASALMQPARLHEIAASAEAQMGDVFDLVNAYDAIGLIEWTPRPRRGDDDLGKAVSLLGRLRKPFGRS